MAILKSITEKWSAVVELTAQEMSIAGRITSGLYQADADNAKVIHAVSVSAPTISDYVPGTPITYADLTDTELQIDMDQKKMYNFKIEDIDKAQSLPDFENPALIEAGRGMALEADKYVFSLYAGAGCRLDDSTYAGVATDAYVVTASNIDTVIGDTMVLMDKKNVGPERNLVVSPAVFKLIVDDARATLTSNEDVFSTGFIANYYGFSVYKSNQLATSAGGVDELVGTHCIALSNRALPFALSVAESENMRLESAFATAHRGLTVFGAGIKWEDEIVDLFLRV